MYAEMKLVGGGVLGTSSETHLKTVWEVFREINVRLQTLKGSFCSIWQVSCAPMSRSATVSDRSFRIGSKIPSSAGAACEIRVRMSW